MSVHNQTAVKRRTVPELMQYKGKQKIACLTAYSAPIARLIDPALDLILVGDSTAMVGYAMDDTLSITLQQMAQHGAAVVRSTQQACVVIDMPFGSYQTSPQQAFENAAYLLAHSGATAVKIEGGTPLADTTRFLVERGIPVLAHVGLMPQYVNTMGGFKAQGMDDEAAARIMADAKAHEAAGAFAVVIEGVAEALGRQITAELAIPTIGIGASPACDGQVLVTEDILGLSGNKIPRFAQKFGDAASVIADAAQRYADEVRGGEFPTLSHCFGVKKSS